MRAGALRNVFAFGSMTNHHTLLCEYLAVGVSSHSLLTAVLCAELLLYDEALSPLVMLLVPSHPNRRDGAGPKGADRPVPYVLRSYR